MSHRGSNLAEGLKIVERNPHLTGNLQTTYHFAGDTLVIDQQQDMEPILAHVQAMRERNALRPFASDKELGHIPELFYQKIRLIRDPVERRKAVRRFFQENPVFCAYAPLLTNRNRG